MKNAMICAPVYMFDRTRGCTRFRGVPRSLLCGDRENDNQQQVKSQLVSASTEEHTENGVLFRSGMKRVVLKDVTVYLWRQRGCRNGTAKEMDRFNYPMVRGTFCKILN